MNCAIYIRVSTEDQAREGPLQICRANKSAGAGIPLRYRKNPYRFVTRSFATTKQGTGAGQNLNIGIDTS